MLRDSGLLQDLEQYAFSTTGQPMCIYGDPAYPLRVHLQGPFRDAYLTPQKQLYNQSMNSVRTSVEWLFACLYGNETSQYFQLDPPSLQDYFV